MFIASFCIDELCQWQVIESKRMGRVSSLSDHPQRQRIIDALVAEQPYRIIQSWTEPKVSTGALARFKQSCVAELIGANRKQSGRGGAAAIYDGPGANNQLRSAMAAQSSPFRPRLDQLWHAAERTLVRAEAAEDVGQVAPLINAAMRTVEVLGRATGELTAGDSNTLNVMVVCPSSNQAQPVPDDVLTIDIGPK